MGSETTPPIGGNIGGNYYDKHGSKNPIARLLVRGFYRAFDRLLEMSGARTLHEAGCGEGVLSLRAASRGVTVSGTDLEPAVVQDANRRAAEAGFPSLFRQGDLYDISPGSMSHLDILVCCEVLEHLPDPNAGLGILARSGAPLLLLSVPREPIWRALNIARFRYLGDWGNTPGHLNHWSRAAFVSFVGQRFDILAVCSPLPWTFVLAKPKPNNR